MNAQGEDVVAGIRTPQPIAELERRHARRRTAQLARHHRRGSRSTTATCRTSSSRSRKARSTCCRRAPASAPAQAAVRIAVDMVDEGLITQRGGGACASSPRSLDQLLHPRARSRRRKLQVLATGLAGVAGRGGRHARCSPPTTRGERGGDGREGDPGAQRDDARRHPRHGRRAGHPDRHRRHDVARRGGRARHGQAVRRAAPARSGSTRRARRFTAGGVTVEARATGSRSTARPAASMLGPGADDRARGDAASSRTFMEWADQFRRLSVRANADIPRDAQQGARVRRRGHRPLPHRAHVLRRGAAAAVVDDDPGRAAREGARAAGRRRRRELEGATGPRREALKRRARRR